MTGSSLDRSARAVLLASFPGAAAPAWLGRHIDLGLGGVCLFGENLVDGAAPVAAALRSARPDVLVATDEEGGDVTRLWAATGSPVPGNATLGAVDDVGLTARVATALGAALLEEGVDLDLAPVADVNCEPANPVIGVRSFGADPALAARHVAAFVTGLQAAGVAACVKHFPGHGSTAVDSHLDLPVLRADLELLRRRELVPFAAAVAAGAASIMTGHLLVPALSRDPATVSRAVLVALLRDELGFTGAVVTDALDMHGIGGPGAIPATVVRALAAGADLCCLGPRATDELVHACVDAIVGAVAAGALDEGRLDDAAARVAAIRRPQRSAPAFDDELRRLGAEVAERAVRVEGELPVSLDGAHVVELQRPSMIAAGEVPWTFGADLAAVVPSVTSERLGEGAPVDAALARAAGRPLVVVARDAERYAAEAQQLAALLAARPDAVVVDIGWPNPEPLRGAARVTTYGASPVSTAAGARLLARSLARSTSLG